MKGKWIVAALTTLLLSIVLFFAVRLALQLVKGLNIVGEAVVDTQELEPWIAPTPDADLFDEDYYDAPDAAPVDDVPTPTPEAMVTVPVLETSEELARDEAP